MEGNFVYSLYSGQNYSSMVFIRKVQRPAVLMLTSVLAVLTSCNTNKSETSNNSSSQVEFIMVRNVNNAIDDCNLLIDVYREEIEKMEDDTAEVDSGLTERSRLSRLGKLNQKLNRSIIELESLSPSFTTDQLYKFKLMQERFYFHEMRAPM